MTLSYTNPGAAQYNRPNIPMPAYPVNQGPMPGQNMAGGMSNPGYYGMPYMPQMPANAPVNNGGPSLSAVKIDINGATMGTGQGASVGQNSGMSPYPSMPMYPGRAQVLNQAPQYQPQPAYMPPPPQYMQAPPQPQFQPQPMPVPAYMTPPYMQTAQTPAQVPPPVIDQQNAVPTPPPPNMQSAQQANAPQNGTVNPAQQPEENVNPIVQPLDNAIKAIAPEEGQNPSLEEQTAAIQTIAQYAKTAQAANEMIKGDPNNPAALQAKQKVDSLINPKLIQEKTFKGLTNIAVGDTSNYSGNEKQKADENKIIGMWTLAMVQKLFREEMNKELKKEGIPAMSMGEVPGVEQVTENIKADPNPEVREAGIVALMEVADPNNPKDKQIMQTILKTAAEQDKADNVKTTAKNALKEFQG